MTPSLKARAARLRLQADYHAAQADKAATHNAFATGFRTRFRPSAEDCAKLEAQHRAKASALLTEAHNLDPNGTP